MNRGAYIHFIEQAYFGNVRSGEIDNVIACFTSGARVIIRHGDKPERVFRVNAAANEIPLEDFYRHLCGNYQAWFGDFEHTIDSAEQRAASRFTVRLEPLPDGLYADAGRQELSNCNFFEFDNGLINHMIIYYANPLAGSSQTPTGYPQ